MQEWHIKPGYSDDILGLLPMIIRSSDPNSVEEQINTRYSHGGGWMPFKGFELVNGNYHSPKDLQIVYPEDPIYSSRAWTRVREELVVLFPHAWVMVMQPDNSFAMCRMD